MVISIPYSNDQSTYIKLKDKYKIINPTIEELSNHGFLKKVLYESIVSSRSVVILEIGGFFAKVAEDISLKLGDRLLGIVEDIEHGHRQYEKYIQKIACPVVSVARSELKEAEDFLVGTSCLYSTEKMIRRLGFPIEGAESLVLGYGKIGRGLSYDLVRKHCPVSVYDTNPIRRIIALSEGFKVPKREVVLRKAQIIYGTTGSFSIGADDFPILKNGVVLVSCSSKDVEFDLEALRRTYKSETIFENFERFENNNHKIYLLAKGYPVNFIDGAVIGPVLALVQSGIILAVKEILELKGKRGIFELKMESKKTLANLWLKHFCDEATGSYRYE